MYARSADAAEVEPVGHVAVAIGSASGPYAGARGGADLAIGAGFIEKDGGEAPIHLTWGQGPLVGVALMVGPSGMYGGLEGGWTTIGLLGFSATVGPALRAYPGGWAGGGEGSVSIELLVLRVGVRVFAVADGDTQITAILGAGNE